MFNNILPWKKRNQPVSYSTDTDNFFDRMLTDWSTFPDRFFNEQTFFPKVDIAEGKKNITVKAEIPGVESDDIDVSLDGRQLIIKGEKQREQKEEQENYYRMEQTYGAFHRSIELPAEVDPEDVDAKFKKGILKLKLKKSKESQPSRIEVQSS